MANTKGFITLNGDKDKPMMGKISVVRTLDESSTPARLLIQGQLVTHWYIDEITELETDRYLIKGVKVMQEAFGSDDFNIMYTFTAKSLEVKGGESNLTNKEVSDIEDKLYGGGDN